jgi:hypothetical protein
MTLATNHTLVQLALPTRIGEQGDWMKLEAVSRDHADSYKGLV